MLNDMECIIYQIIINYFFFRLLGGRVKLSWKVYKEIIMDYKQYITRENNY